MRNRNQAIYKWLVITIIDDYRILHQFNLVFSQLSSIIFVTYKNVSLPINTHFAYQTHHAQNPGTKARGFIARISLINRSK